MPRAHLRIALAKGLHIPNPEQASWGDIYKKIDCLPGDGFVHPQDLRDQIACELDGAHPLF